MNLNDLQRNDFLGLVPIRQVGLAADTHPEAEQALVELLRGLSAARKVAMMLSANRTARALALSGLRERFPGESSARLQRRLADLWLGPELAAKAYGPLLPQ